MRFLLIPLLILSACNTVTRVDDNLKKAMAIGKVIELNAVESDQEKDLFLRLYQIPSLEEDCFNETHGVCKYEYYLSVSTFDEYPETNVFKLKTKGEFIDAQWRSEEKLDYVEIDFKMNTYAKEALDNNVDLKNNVLNIQLKLDTKTINETVR